MSQTLYGECICSRDYCWDVVKKSIVTHVGLVVDLPRECRTVYYNKMHNIVGK